MNTNTITDSIRDYINHYKLNISHLINTHYCCVILTAESVEVSAHSLQLPRPLHGIPELKLTPEDGCQGVHHGQLHHAPG